MFKRLVLVSALSIVGLGAGSLHADLVAKDSATDKALGHAINVGADATALAVSLTSGALSDIVTSTIATLKSGKDFVMQEAPKVIKEFMYWRMAQCGFWAGIFLLMILFLQFPVGLLHRAALAEMKVMKSDNSDWNIGANLIRYMLCPLLFLVGVCPNIYEALYITIAPRIYLIENVAHLIKFGGIQP